MSIPKKELYVPCCIFVAAFLCIVMSPFSRALTTIETVTVSGYSVAGSNAPPETVTRWSWDYTPDEIEQLSLNMPYIQQLPSAPGNRVLLVEVNNQSFKAPAELELAIGQPSQPQPFSWLSYIGSLLSTGQTQKHRISLEHTEGAPSQYLESLSGSVDWKNSFITDAEGNKFPLLPGPGEVVAGAEVLEDLKFLEINLLPALPRPAKDGSENVGSLDSELKDFPFGDGGLLVTGGGGGGGYFGPDHRPGGGGGGGGGVQTESTLLITSISLKAIFAKVGGVRQLVSIQLPPKKGLVRVQRVSASGWLLAEEYMDFEAMLALLTNGGIPAEEDRYATDLMARARVRLQINRELTEEDLRGVLASVVYRPCEIHGIINCPIGGKGGQQKGAWSTQGDGSTYYSTAGAAGGAGDGASGGASGGAAGGAGGGDDDEWSSDSGSGAETRTVAGVDGLAVKSEMLIAQLTGLHEEATKAWNTRRLSNRINWSELRRYLPPTLDDEQYLKLTRTPDLNTFNEVTNLIIGSMTVDDGLTRNPEQNWVAASSFFQMQLKYYLRDMSSMPADEWSELNSYFTRRASLIPEFYHFMKDKPQAAMTLNWEQMIDLAQSVLSGGSADDDLLRTRLNNNEREIRYYIFHFSRTKSDNKCYRNDINLPKSEGRKQVGVEVLLNNLRQHGIRDSQVLLALAVLDKETSLPSTSTGYPRMTGESEVKQAIKSYMLKNWQLLPSGSESRRALAQFSLMVLKENFLPASSSQAQGASSSTASSRAAYSPPVPAVPFVSDSTLDKSPDMITLSWLPGAVSGTSLNIIKSIGPNYKAFLSRLLDDRYDTTVRSLEAQYRHNPEDIVRSGLQDWVRGPGLLPKSWRVLIQTLTETGLNTLADDIKRKLAETPLSRLDTRPTLRLLTSMDSSRGHSPFRIIQQTAAQYHTLGIFLLDDGNGSELASITEMDRNPVSIITTVYQRWLSKDPKASWSELIRILRLVNLNVLASDLQEELR